MIAGAPRVLVLGVQIVDVLGRTITHLPNGQNSERIEAIRMTAAGTAAGTAVDFAKLGCAVVCHGAVGDDDLGAYLEAKLSSFGVTPSLARIEDVQTSASMLAITAEGDRPVWHVPGANAAFSGDHLDYGLLAAQDAIHLGGVDSMPGLDTSDAQTYLEVARDAGLLVSVDLQSANADLLTSRRVTDVLGLTDVFMPNLDQARKITGGHDEVVMARDLASLGPSVVVIKLGDRGCYVHTEVESFWVRCKPVDVVDTTGCGDAFCAAFVTARLHDFDFYSAARIAVAAGSLTATGLGSDAGIVNFEETVRAVGSLTKPELVHRSDGRLRRR